MNTVWTQRREEVLCDCLVSPDVFTQMLDRLGEFVVPYQQALETETGRHPMHLYLQGLLSHVDRKNAEKIAALVDVERQVIQDFIGTASWDHRPLITVLVRQVAERLGEPDGIIAFDPSSFPKRGTHSVGVKRQWCGHRGKVDNCQVGVFMGYVSAPRPTGAPPVPAGTLAPARFSGQAADTAQRLGGRCQGREAPSGARAALTEGVRAAATLLHRQAGLGSRFRHGRSAA